MAGGMATSLSTDEASHSWWCLRRHRSWSMEIRVATRLSTAITSTATRWWRVDGRWGLLITGALTPASLSGGILLLGWLLSFAIT